MSKLSLPVAAFAAGILSLAGCGGGGGGAAVAEPAGTAALSGRVVARDGTTSNLGGLRLTCLRTGETATTGPTGAFDFGTVPAGTISLRLVDPAALLVAQARGEDDETREDRGDATNEDAHDDGDDRDVGDDDCDITGVSDGSEVYVEIEVRDGKIDRVRHACSDGDRREGKVRLTRAETSDDPDVTGEAGLASRGDLQKLEVEAEHLDVGRAVRAVVICEGVDADLGVVTADPEGEAEWEVATNDGGVLPHGALTVADLVGCRVEVRDATTGTVLLFGTLAELPTSVDGDHDDDDGHDDGDHDGHESMGRAYLTRSEGVDGRAHVEVLRREDDGELRQKFEVEVEYQAVGLVLELWMEDAVGSNVLANVAQETVGERGEAEFEFAAHEGGGLPFGVTEVGELVGRAVEVRDAADGAVLFRGVVPPLVGED